MNGLAFLALLAVGLIFAHAPILFSGFTQIQADPVDPRLINYILEHTYAWLTGVPLHERLWDPPIFYPTPNVLAYSDTFLTAAPFYWVWRFAGCLPDTSYQLWMLTASTLNFLTMTLFLRKGLGLGSCGALAGAFLFAFGAPRVNQIYHAQLFTQYFSILMLFALVLGVSRRGDPAWKRTLWWCLTALGLAAQTYASFYLGWFLVLGLAITVVGSLGFPGLRTGILSILRSDVVPLLIAAAVGIVTIWPLFTHSQAAAAELGYRTFHEALISTPDWYSWLYQGPETWLYPWGLRMLSLDLEHRLGMGLITPVAVGIGLYLNRGIMARVCSIGLVGLWLCVTRFSSEFMILLTLMVLILNLTWLILKRDNNRSLALLTGSTCLLALILIPVSVLMLVAPFFGVAMLGAWYLERTGRGTRLWPFVLVAVITFGFFVTYADALEIWGPGTLCMIVGSVVLNRRGLDLPTRWLFVVGVSLAALLLINGPHLMLWKVCYYYVFGGNAIRAVGRASLVVLIPASIGLAFTFDDLWKRGQWLAVGLLAFICALEQGVAPPSYDKYIERQKAHEVAIRVPANANAFFAGVLQPSENAWQIHLDAMWAELECHVPTINGYSGGQPKGWDKFYLPQPGSGTLLIQWGNDHGLDPSRICWVYGWPEQFGLMPPVSREVFSPQ